jgi:hypothetical protein
MARMYPNQLSPDTRSEAERRLYAAFRDELDNSYTVFHSVAWQSLDPAGRPRDGEADFVIAHPQRGILVMEAKGGTIHCDPRTGRWTSTDRSGQVHDIKDPFRQARDSKYILLDQLKLMLGDPRRRINIGHAVAFPDGVAGGALPGLDKPRDIILDATDLTNLSGWVGGALAYARGQSSSGDTAPGEEAVEALMKLLGKAWELRPALWGEFVQEQDEIIRLTQQQFMILGMLNRHRRAAISGCAGSGKTMLAAEKASRLARQGFHVLFTCFNKNLAADLRDRLKPSENLDIIHFHGLCYGLARDANVLPAMQDDETFFDQQLPEACMEAADILGVQYDAIVVDEGQDFLEDWWIPIQTLLRDPDDGILYIFFDDNQRIYVRHSTFPIQQPPYSLTVNCRNTQNIHRVVLQFYAAEEQPTARGPEGRPPELIFYDRPHRLRATLQDVLLHLTREERIPTDEITVLSPLREKSRLWGTRMPQGPQLTDRWPAPPGQVYFSTIYSFKGLECAVIILVEIDQWPGQASDLNHLLYVGCSRARNHLIVLLCEEADPEVRAAFTMAGG